MKKDVQNIIKAMLKAKTEEEWGKVTLGIDWAFQHEKITWQDNELLYDLVSRLWQR